MKKSVLLTLAMTGLLFLTSAASAQTHSEHFHPSVKAQQDSASYQIFVKTLTGKTIVLEVK